MFEQRIWRHAQEEEEAGVTEFFEKLMKQVIDKQENLQTKFVEVLDKYEQDRTELHGLYHSM